MYTQSYTRVNKRIGLMMGGWYALAGTTSITQMFDVHERGLRVGVWNFARLNIQGVFTPTRKAGRHPQR